MRPRASGSGSPARAAARSDGSTRRRREARCSSTGTALVGGRRVRDGSYRGRAGRQRPGGRPPGFRLDGTPATLADLRVASNSKPFAGDDALLATITPNHDDVRDYARVRFRPDRARRRCTLDVQRTTQAVETISHAHLGVRRRPALGRLGAGVDDRGPHVRALADDDGRRRQHPHLRLAQFARRPAPARAGRPRDGHRRDDDAGRATHPGRPAACGSRPTSLRSRPRC